MREKLYETAHLRVASQARPSSGAVRHLLPQEKVFSYTLAVSV